MLKCRSFTLLVGNDVVALSLNSQEELTVLLEKLEIDLKDKVNDPAIIFQAINEIAAQT